MIIPMRHSIALSPRTLGASAFGVPTDMEKWGPAFRLIVTVGTVSGTLPQMWVFAQDSDDGLNPGTPGWHNIEPATVFVFNTSDQYREFDFVRRRRFVRARFFVTGTLPSFPCCGLFLQNRRPVGV